MTDFNYLTWLLPVADTQQVQRLKQDLGTCDTLSGAHAVSLSATLVSLGYDGRNDAGGNRFILDLFEGRDFV